MSNAAALVALLDDNAALLDRAGFNASAFASTINGGALRDNANTYGANVYTAARRVADSIDRVADRLSGTTVRSTRREIQVTVTVGGNTPDTRALYNLATSLRLVAGGSAAL